MPVFLPIAVRRHKGVYRVGGLRSRVSVRLCVDAMSSPLPPGPRVHRSEAFESARRVSDSSVPLSSARSSHAAPAFTAPRRCPPPLTRRCAARRLPRGRRSPGWPSIRPHLSPRLRGAGFSAQPYACP